MGEAEFGLSICKKIAELHGGNLKIDSEEGYGTTVYFDLELNTPSDVEME